MLIHDKRVAVARPPGGRRSRWPLWFAGTVILVAVGLLVAANTVWKATEPSAPQGPSRSYTSPIGFTIAYPADWVWSRFEGHDEFRPSKLPSLARGGPTFAIDITTPELTSGPACSVRPDAVALVGGLRAAGCEIRGADGGVDAWYVARFEAPTVNIVVHVLGSTSALWSAYDDTARATLATLGPVPTPVATHGTIARGIAMNAYVRTLIGFLEARVTGRDGDLWMMQNAADLYAGHEGGLSLYADAGANPWTSYEVTEIRGVDANSVEFDVTMRSSATTSVETIGVGAGANVAQVTRPAVIRFAVKG